MLELSLNRVRADDGSNGCVTGNHDVQKKRWMLGVLENLFRYCAGPAAAANAEMRSRAENDATYYQNSALPIHRTPEGAPPCSVPVRSAVTNH